MTEARGKNSLPIYTEIANSSREKLPIQLRFRPAESFITHLSLIRYLLKNLSKKLHRLSPSAYLGTVICSHFKLRSLLFALEEKSSILGGL